MDYHVRPGNSRINPSIASMYNHDGARCASSLETQTRLVPGPTVLQHSNVFLAMVTISQKLPATDTNSHHSTCNSFMLNHTRETTPGRSSEQGNIFLSMYTCLGQLESSERRREAKCIRQVVTTTKVTQDFPPCASNPNVAYISSAVILLPTVGPSSL
jgi:hypothetical protein